MGNTHISLPALSERLQMHPKTVLVQSCDDF